MHVVQLLQRPKNSVAMSCRAKNDATPRDVLQAMRACYRSLDVATFNMPDFGQVIQNHIAFIRQVLKLTRRPNEKLLEQAGILAFPENVASVKLFAGQVCRAVSMCRQKKGKVTSGSRQLPEILEVMKLLEVENPVVVEVSPKRAGSPAAEPAAKTRAFSSRSLSTVELSPSRILASYGLKSKATAVHLEPLEILSSQENCDSGAKVPPALEHGSASCSSRGSQAGTIYLDSTRRALVRVVDGQLQVAEMFPGPGGCAQGKFLGDSVEYPSEMPNLLLTIPEAKAKLPQVLRRPARGAVRAEAKIKAKAKAKAKAKVLVHEVEDEGEEEESKEEDFEVPPTQEYSEDGKPPEVPAPPAELAGEIVLKYAKMWYKSSRSVGIRECFLNKAQICSFRSPDQTFGEDALWELADRALDRLNNGGQTVQAVKTWLTSQGVHVSQPRLRG